MRAEVLNELMRLGNKEREALTTAVDVAAFIDQIAEDYAREFGYNDMGSLSFGQGDHAQAKMDHYTTLMELADEIRARANHSVATAEMVASQSAEPVALTNRRPATIAEMAAQYETKGGEEFHIGSGLPKATCPCGLCAKVRRIEGTSAATGAQGLTEDAALIRNTLQRIAEPFTGTPPNAFEHREDAARSLEALARILAQSAPRADHSGERAEMVADARSRIEYFLKTWEWNGTGETIAERGDSPDTTVALTVADFRTILATPSASAGQAEPVAALHSNGRWEWKDARNATIYKERFAGFKMDVYAAPAPSASPAALTGDDHE